MNTKPILPNLTCPVPTDDPDTYFSAQQSQVNVTRKDKFMLVIDVPCILKPILLKENRVCHGGNMERLTMSIWGFIIPEIKVDVMTKQYGGQTLKFSNLSRPSYPSSTVNFTVDNRFDNYFIIYKWIDIQNDEIYSQFDAKLLDPNSRGFLPDYASTFTVYALDEYDKPTAKWDFIGAFPTALKNVDSSSRETGELESSFTFDYSQLKMSLL